MYTASAEASTTMSIFLIQSLLTKVSAKIKKNLAPLIVEIQRDIYTAAYGHSKNF